MKVFQIIRKWLFIGVIFATLNLGFSAFLSAQETKDADPLKIALLPILDTFPYHVAEAKGYFRTYGVNAEAVPVASGLERDQLMQSGEIDGMLNEMITTANFNRKRVQVKTVISARKAYPHYPLFRVLSSPGSELALPTKLSGISIGISKNTIIEYVTDRLLAAEGVNLNEIRRSRSCDRRLQTSAIQRECIEFQC
jgi:NitT/TauT family transport system substrate-binding protein